jgi:hypothetical protein
MCFWVVHFRSLNCEGCQQGVLRDANPAITDVEVYSQSLFSRSVASHSFLNVCPTTALRDFSARASSRLLYHLHSKPFSLTLSAKRFYLTTAPKAVICSPSHLCD